MTTHSAVSMKSAIEQILQAHSLLSDFMKAEDFSARIQSSGYMPLSIERHGDVVAVTHYFTQNSDLIPDPDMEFKIAGDAWVPVAIQYSSGSYHRPATDAKRRGLWEFSKLWASNLLAQGFESGTVDKYHSGS